MYATESEDGVFGAKIPKLWNIGKAQKPCYAKVGKFRLSIWMSASLLYIYIALSLYR